MKTKQIPEVVVKYNMNLLPEEYILTAMHLNSGLNQINY